MAKKWHCQIGTNNATKMLCTKILIYIKFPVDMNGNWCKIVIWNMIYLISKIFHTSLLVNMLVKFQTEFGDPRPHPIWFFWPISMKTKILAPESAQGLEHFQCCVILGHPIEDQWKIILCNKIYNAFLSTKVSFPNGTYKKPE